jgi:hypothetical protein
MNNKTTGITKNQGKYIWTTRLLLKAGRKHMNNNTITKTKENAYEQQDYY